MWTNEGGIGSGCPTSRDSHEPVKLPVLDCFNPHEWVFRTVHLLCIGLGSCLIPFQYKGLLLL